jgi:Nuclear transport factor 2 (NTF2) domain
MTRQDIEAREQEFVEAFNSGDASGVACLFTEDGRVLPPNADAVQGRASIEAFFKEDQARRRSRCACSLCTSPRICASRSASSRWSVIPRERRPKWTAESSSKCGRVTPTARGSSPRTSSTRTCPHRVERQTTRARYAAEGPWRCAVQDPPGTRSGSTAPFASDYFEGIPDLVTALSARMVDLGGNAIGLLQLEGRGLG